jgi:hypothetical protein
MLPKVFLMGQPWNKWNTLYDSMEEKELSKKKKGNTGSLILL